MTAEPATDLPFVDHYLTLQLHPRADAAMVDAAYWHLARRYSEAAQLDPSYKPMLDELNEAYSVIGSSTRREAYDRERIAILGSEALPLAPAQTQHQTPPPLAVMERQQIRERATDEPRSVAQPRAGLLRRAVLRWRSIAPALMAFVLALTAAATGVPLFVSGAIVALGVFSAVIALAGRRRTDRAAQAVPAAALQRPVPELPARRPDTPPKAPELPPVDDARQWVEQARQRLRQESEKKIV